MFIAPVVVLHAHYLCEVDSTAVIGGVQVHEPCIHLPIIRPVGLVKKAASAAP